MKPKRIEQILEQPQDLTAVPSEAQTSEQKDAVIQSKSKFIDNMAFQIRTLSNAILGFSELLLNEEITQTQREYVNEIFQAGQGMVSLVNDVLDMTRLENGQLQAQLEDCSLAWLLDEIDILVRPAAVEKGLAFEIKTGADLPANIRTDPRRLRQCLIIMAGNAVKFTRKGHVHIDASLAWHQDHAYVRFDVIDSGMGIPKDKQATIFQPYSQYEQVSESMLTSLELGLTANSGLAATTQLVQLLGGRIAVTSEMGKGSVFSLVIPAGLDVRNQAALPEFHEGQHVSSNPINEPAPVSAPSQCCGHVLLVEDLPSNQTVVSLLLETMGLKVSLAENGQQAIEKAMANAYDLILMDIKMPVMDGIVTTKILRQNGLATPIIALSAANEPTSRDFDGFLAKPVDSQGLFGAISRYLPVTNLASNALPDDRK